MIYFFIQHKVHRIPGGECIPFASIYIPLNEIIAYTHYAFFEWALILLDVLYDSILKIDLEHANLQVRRLYYPKTYY